MRRILFTLAVSGALIVLAPATALARHHHRSHHRSVRHARVRRERWGSTDTGQQAPSSEQNAGVVAAPGLMNGVLTIQLNDGTMVSGKVTDATRIECEAAKPTTMQTDDHHGGNDGGPGDDNGGNGDDQGENQQNCTTVALTTGTTVREAELSVSSAGAIWDKIDLATQQTTTNNPGGDNGDDNGGDDS